jgi:hypothetical protein
MTDSNNEEQQPEETSAPAMTDEQGTLGAIQIAVPVVENMVRMITGEVEA